MPSETPPDECTSALRNTQDPRDCKSKGHPAIFPDRSRLCPVRRDGDQIPCHQPDTDIGKHPKDHSYCGESKPQECQPFVAACIVKQDSYIALFSFLSYASLLSYFKAVACLFITFSAILIPRIATGIVRINTMIRAGMFSITGSILSTYPAGISSMAADSDLSVSVHQ